MSKDNNFILKAKKEIKKRIKDETKILEQLRKEYEELINALKGYTDFDKELEKFIDESCSNFNVDKEKLPKYFKSNINEVYQNYSQIRKDALDEIEILKKYIEKIKKDSTTSQKTLKFYRSQDMDSDFYDECLPLIEIIEEKLEIYRKNEDITLDIISKLEQIHKKLEKWE